MKSGGKFTLYHQMIHRLKITPDRFMEMPEWSRKIIMASLQLRLEELQSDEERVKEGLTDGGGI